MEGRERHEDAEAEEQRQKDLYLVAGLIGEAGYLEHIKCIYACFRPGGEVQRKEPEKGYHRAKAQVKGQVHRGVFPVRAAPYAYERIHGDDREFVEQEEEHEVQGHENAVDSGNKKEEKHVMFSYPVLYADPRDENAGEDDDGGKQHHRDADAVDAEVVRDAERLHPLYLFDELEAALHLVINEQEVEGEREACGRGRDRNAPYESDSRVVNEKEEYDRRERRKHYK